jgi:hypothetical protein
MPPSLPPPVALYQMSVGHYGSRALNLAAKLGVADQLAGSPRDARALAAATETDPVALARVLRFLVSAGVFDEDEDGRFALTPIGELLRGGVPGSMRASVLLFTGVGIQDSWREIEWCVRTGQPAFRRESPDADAFTQIAADPEGAALFDEAMAAFAPQTAAVVAAAYDFSTFATVVDVGGGNGALLLGILQRYPKLRGIVFDRPDVVERARAHLAKNGMAERCTVVGGSFFERVPDGADAYLLKHVIHDWSDEQAATILRHVRAAIPAHGKLLIVEGLYPARVDRSLESRGATANDVNMLICTGGRQRSEAEFRELYAAAGFRLSRVVPTVAQVCVIEGECA